MLTPLATLSERAKVFSFTFPIATATIGTSLGTLAFCASCCVLPAKRLARRGSLSSVRS